MTRRTFAGLLASRALYAAGQTTFDFHSGFWLNLHLVLYNLAFGRKEGRMPDVSALNPAETAIWNGALDYYETNVIGRQIGDFRMILISRELSAAGGADRLEPREGDPVFPVLERVAPVYREHFWSAHNRKSQEWIDHASLLIAAHEEALRPELARAYDTRWPTGRVRVEMSYYLTGNSAYTSLGPTLVTVSSWSKRNAGAAGIETVFHEAGHAMVERVQQEMKAAESRLRRKLVHEDLWHALMFYTTGELVRRRVPDLEPYAIKYGLWENSWPGALPVMERDWKPFLDGRGTFGDAIDAIVRNSV